MTKERIQNQPNECLPLRITASPILAPFPPSRRVTILHDLQSYYAMLHHIAKQVRLDILNVLLTHTNSSLELGVSASPALGLD